jgi:squalene cyclase
MDISNLLAGQRADGGWGYHRGGSATEPTVFALLVLSVAGCGQTEGAKRAVQWLRINQRPDGGWPPNPTVDQSTWVTALPMLLPEPLRSSLDLGRALEWILAQQGRESKPIERFKAFLRGDRLPVDASQEGWPFYPDTAAWVGPTSFAILALQQFSRDPRARERCRLGREFLLSRMCPDGGWNYGNSRVLGYDLPSYPETTGLALLALYGTSSRSLTKSLDEAGKQLDRSESLEARSWLQLGLLAHKRPLPGTAVQMRNPRSVLEMSLTLLVSAAVAGNNVFLSKTA